MGKTVINILKYTLSLAVACVLVWLVARKIDWQGFLTGLRSTRWVYMAGYASASVLALVFRAKRWKQLLKPLDRRIRYGRCWDANNIGNLGSLAIPGSCEPIRAGIITSKKMPFQTVFGTMIMERAWDFLCIFLTFIIALMLKWDTFGTFVKVNILGSFTHSGLLWGIIIALAFLGAGFIWAAYHFRERSRFLAKVAAIIDGMLTGLGSFGRINNKLPFLIYTALIWVMYMLMSFFCLKAIPELSGLDMADALFLSALGNVASIVPVPGGIGAYHYLLILCLSSLYGFSDETGLLFAMLNHEGHAVLVLVLGLWSYIMRMVIMKNRNASEIRAERRSPEQ